MAFCPQPVMDVAGFVHPPSLSNPLAAPSHGTRPVPRRSLSTPVASVQVISKRYRHRRAKPSGGPEVDLRGKLPNDRCGRAPGDDAGLGPVSRTTCPPSPCRCCRMGLDCGRAKPLSWSTAVLSTRTDTRLDGGLTAEGNWMRVICPRRALRIPKGSQLTRRSSR